MYNARKFPGVAAYPVVSHTGKSFHRGLIPRSHTSAGRHGRQGNSSTRGEKGVRRFLGFHLGAARAQHIQSVLPGFAIAIFAILGQKIDHMAEFVQQD